MVTKSRFYVFPALAGFQSEHDVEIPFMLTSEEENDSEIAARGSKRPRIGGVWDYSSNWKCSGEGSHEFLGCATMKF